MKHIIVVGSGIAGLIAALELSRKHAVTLVTKAALEDSNTRFAQGGIAAAMFSDDSVAEHIADTLRAGAGLCNPEAVEVLCSEGPGPHSRPHPPRRRLRPAQRRARPRPRSRAHPRSRPARRR